MKCIITLEYERGREDKATLELISQLLGLPTTTTQVTVSEKPETTEEPVVEPTEQVAEQPAEPNGEPSLKIDDIRKLCTEKAKISRDAVMKILGEFGCKSVFELPAEKYGEFKTKLETIKTK